MLTSSGNLLFTVGITLLLRHCAGDDVIGDVIVSTLYGRVRGRRVQRDYGLGPGLYLFTYLSTKVINNIKHFQNVLQLSRAVLFPFYFSAIFKSCGLYFRP